MKTRIYFETGPLDPLHEIDYELGETLYIASCRSGYRAMINDAKCIILVGYMCAGKTTVGKVLAKKMGRTFYDLDWYIEERFPWNS